MALKRRSSSPSCLQESAPESPSRTMFINPTGADSGGRLFWGFTFQKSNSTATVVKSLQKDTAIYPYSCGPCKQFFKTRQGYLGHCLSNKHNIICSQAFVLEPFPSTLQGPGSKIPPETEYLFIKVGTFKSPALHFFSKTHMCRVHTSRIKILDLTERLLP